MSCNQFPPLQRHRHRSCRCTFKCSLYPIRFSTFIFKTKKVIERSGECHNHKPQPFPDTKRKRKQTKPNKRKSNKRTKSTKICFLFPKRGKGNAKRTKTQEQNNTSKTQNKSPRRINHKATKSKINTGTTALERPVE